MRRRESGMASLTMRFKLPEEKWEFLLANKAHEFYQALTEIQNEIRNHRKYEKKLKDCFQAIEAICQEVETDF
jgi:hypothetical protein